MVSVPNTIAEFNTPTDDRQPHIAEIGLRVLLTLGLIIILPSPEIEPRTLTERVWFTSNASHLLIDHPSEAPSGPVVSSGNSYLKSLDLLLTRKDINGVCKQRFYYRCWAYN